MWLSAAAIMTWMGSPAQARENSRPELSLVGFYDLASVMGVTKKNGSQYRWVPKDSMTESCGNAKAPYNMNIMEAEAVASGMMPTLMVVLKREGEIEYFNRKNESCERGSSLDCKAVPVTNEDLRVGLGISKVDFPLQPMVMPRNMYVSIKGSLNEQDSGADGTTRSLSGEAETSKYEKLIKTQVELELCLEHKVGRAWLGGDKNQLRQGFLLDPADQGENDRKFFNGQRDPIPALISAPQSCLDSPFSAKSMALKGKDDLVMTPSDIWGATLPACISAQKDRPIARNPKLLPLKLSQDGNRMLGAQRDFWSVLDISISASGKETQDVRLNVKYNGNDIMTNKKMFPEDGKFNLIRDILPEIPYDYPLIGTKDDPDSYVVLMIPNWQIVEGLRRMYSRVCADTSGTSSCQCEVSALNSPLLPDKKIDDLTKADFDILKKRMRCKDIDGKLCELNNVRPKALKKTYSPLEQCYQQQLLSTPMKGVGGAIFDGVGWLLQNPQHLFVQVPIVTEEGPSFSILDYLPQDPALEGDKNKANIMAAVGGPSSKLDIRNWGYTVGLLSGRAPIVSLGDKRLKWEQSANVQHATQHSYFVIAFCSLFVFLFVGIRRFPDYWTQTPKERAYYWPGRQADNEQGEPEGVEGAEGMEAAGGEE